MGKFDVMKLPRELDRRLKITDEQRGEIRKMYAEGCWTMRELGEKYGISASMVCYIVNQKTRETRRNYMREHPGAGKTNEENRVYREELRRRKRESLARTSKNETTEKKNQ